MKLTPVEITQEASKLLNPFYFWGVACECIPQQITKHLNQLGVPIETNEELKDAVGQLVQNLDIPTLQSISSNCQFDWSAMHEDYPLVIAKFQELSKNYKS